MPTAGWPELVRTVVASGAGEDPERWLGELVVEVQKASDRAVATARDMADSLVADARSEAISIREAGRRRAHDLSRMRALLRPLPGSGAEPYLAPGAEVGPRAPSPRPVPIGNRQEVPAPVSPARNGPSGADRQLGDGAVLPSPPRPTDGAGSGRPPGPAPGRLGEATLSRASRGGPSWFRRMGPRATAVGAAVAVVASLAGLYVFERDGTARRERASQHQLAAELAVAESRLDPRRPTSGMALGFLDVPRLAVDTGVVEGATIGNLRQGPAHDSMSPMPGEGGVVVILGHRRTYGGPFHRLGELQVGDVVSIKTPVGMYLYRVSRKPQVLAGSRSTLQLPSPVQAVPAGATGESLVLATSANTWGGGLEVVVATLQQSGSLSTPGTPHSGASAPRLRMVLGDRVALLFVLFWLATLVGGAYLGRRFRKRLSTAWILGPGTIVVLVAVYQIYLAIDRMVPGTY